jgi:hypothetical protein
LPQGSSYYFDLFKKEVLKMAKGKSKYVSFAAQREQCRLNKFTYTEKCGCGIVSLMCNYPFDDTKHKKGMCRASTCTDMRKTLADDVDAILGEEAPPEEVIKDESGGLVACKAEEPQTGDNIDDSGDTDSHTEEANAQEEAQEEADPRGAVRAE